MTRKFFFISACIFAVLLSFAQHKPVKIIGKYNHTDKNGMMQGFWKISLPDAMGHSSNYEEGVYYNGKKVGVWYRRNYEKKKYRMEIFYDTTQDKLEQFDYYWNSEVIKGHGFLFLTPLGRTDTFDYVDPVTNKKKRITWDSKSMKQGKWIFYYENGQIESEGLYKDDTKNGIWSYYNEKGELLKKEDN